MCERATRAAGRPASAWNGIPRVLHQLWIGPHPRPQRCLDSWAERHGPAQDFRYMLWDEAALEREGMTEAARRRGVLPAIEAMGSSWCGKADVWRWVILAERGGMFSDADAECLLSCAELLPLLGRTTATVTTTTAATTPGLFVAAFENEAVRGAGCFPHMPDVPQDVPLVANGFVACGPAHPVVLNALDEIAAQPVAALKARVPWRSVGPALLTRVLRRLAGGNKAMLPSAAATAASTAPWLRLLPSYTFYPVHATGLRYRGHGKVFAHQLWGSTPGAAPPPPLHSESESKNEPAVAVSVLVCSRDARAHHLRACLDSVLHQQGEFAVELVWVDDRSSAMHAAILGRMLDDLELRSRRLTVRRLKIGEPGGVAAALQAGLPLCSHDLVARMDADDIMALDRLERQLAFMAEHPHVDCLGAQVSIFRDGEDVPHSQTHHPAHLRAEELAAYGAARMPRWIANHPTLMFRKRAVLAAGGYRHQFDGAEDYDLLLRLLLARREIRNLPDVLLYYRQSAGQVTAGNHERRAAMQDQLAADFVAHFPALAKPSAPSPSNPPRPAPESDQPAATTCR
jgi:hypothetical protein